MAEPSLSEDTDLARLIERIRSEHGDAASIIYHDVVRRGGVLGFFAREVHRVAYRVAEDVSDSDEQPALSSAELPAGVEQSAELPVGVEQSAVDASAELPVGMQPSAVDASAELPVGIEPSAVDALLAYADVADGPDGVDQTLTSDFATILQHSVAAADEAPVFQPLDHPVIPASEVVREVPPGSAESAPAEPGLASVTPIGSSPARSRLDTLLELREVGVPVTMNPGTQAHSMYQAIDAVLSELPPAPPIPRGAGDIIALVGPLTPALRTAAALCAQLGIRESDIWIAGLLGHPVGRLSSDEEASSRSINGIGDALRLRSELRTATAPAVVLVATDTVDAQPGDPWAAELVEALAPTTTWAVLDATSKPEDARAWVASVPRVDALAVHSVQASASPATVWDIGMPIVMIDGRPADTFVWSTVLFGALRSATRHRASA
jgi:hypothetical protein